MSGNVHSVMGQGIESNRFSRLNAVACRCAKMASLLVANASYDVEHIEDKHRSISTSPSGDSFKKVRASNGLMSYGNQPCSMCQKMFQMSKPWQRFCCSDCRKDWHLGADAE